MLCAESVVVPASLSLLDQIDNAGRKSLSHDWALAARLLQIAMLAPVVNHPTPLITDNAKPKATKTT